MDLRPSQGTGRNIAAVTLQWKTGGTLRAAEERASGVRGKASKVREE